MFIVPTMTWVFGIPKHFLFVFAVHQTLTNTEVSAQVKAPYQMTASLAICCHLEVNMKTADSFLSLADGVHLL